LHAISPFGLQIWGMKLGGPIEASPAIDAVGTVYVGADDGVMYAVAQQ
jgi:outer membrane protein assembly factor BamB